VWSRTPMRRRTGWRSSCDARGSWIVDRGSQLQTSAGRGGAECGENQIVVRQTGRAGGLGKAGVVGWIGEDAREGIHLDDVRRSLCVEANVDARPVAAAEHAIGAQDRCFDRLAESRIDASRALEDVERFVRRVP